MICYTQSHSNWLIILYSIAYIALLLNPTHAIQHMPFRVEQIQRVVSTKTCLIASALGLYAVQQWYRKQSTPQEYTIADGLTYQRVILGNVCIHHLIADPQKISLMPALACNTATGSERPSYTARRHHALAAINGGFFDYGVSATQALCIKLLDCFSLARYDAFPLYTLKIEHTWHSVAGAVPTGVLAWGDALRHIGNAKTSVTLHIGTLALPVIDWNKRTTPYQVIYTSAYGKPTPDIPGTSILIHNSYVKGIIEGGNICIQPGWYLYFIKDTLPQISLNAQASLTFSHVTDNDNLRTALEHEPHALASTPVLINKSRVTQEVTQGRTPFFTTLHPRTAVGILADGRWLLVVVDGRSMRSVGMSLKTLALYLQQRGCTDALNLDGGGSSTMVIDGRVVNRPSGRMFARERPCATTLLVLPRRPVPLNCT